MSIQTQVLAELNVLTFTKVNEREFKALTPCPDFFNDLYRTSLAELFSTLHPNSCIESYFLADAFDYLEYFLEDAVEFWEDPTNSIDKSGVWTQENSHKQEFQFEAQALLIEKQPILLIHNLTQSFVNQKAIYQTARDFALANEKLKIELNKQQRLFQSELNKQVAINLHHISHIEPFLNSKEMGILICKPGGLGEMKNQVLCKLTGADNEHSHIFKQWLKEAETDYPEVHRVISSGENWEGEFKSQLVTSKTWVRLTVSSIFYSNKEIAFHVCVLNELHNYNNRTFILDNALSIDQITNLPNRNAFWQKLKQSVNQSKKSNIPSALIYIDLDHFQQVNMELGHNSGDFILTTIAARLSHLSKNEAYISHLGGDEYALIISGQAQIDNAEAFATHLLEAIAQPISVDGLPPVSITASAGIAAFPKDAQNSSELLLKADLAMAYAKKSGRKKVYSFKRSSEQETTHHLRLHSEVTRALNNDEFFLVYQPIVAFKEDKQFHAEALIRWKHPERGLQGPSYFIDSLEESGQIVELSKWVFNKACERVRHLENKGVSLVISVNMSTKDLSSPAFLDTINQAMSKYNVNPQSFDIEITETALFEDIHLVTPTLKKLKDMGFSISLDDFGAGYSSLNYLKELPANRLKIDRAFIKDLPQDQDSRIISSSVIKLAHKLNLKVVAEGIETLPQANMLRNMGCEFAQGFYFYKPIEEPELLKIYQQWYQQKQLAPSQSKPGIK